MFKEKRDLCNNLKIVRINIDGSEINLYRLETQLRVAGKCKTKERKWRTEK